MYENIRKLREDKDLSQKEMAAYLQIHQTTYSDYELGNLNIPVSILCKLADFYQTSIDFLVARTNGRPIRPKRSTARGFHKPIRRFFRKPAYDGTGDFRR